MERNKEVKVIITDVESRKSFDVVNIMQRLYGADCILCAGKDFNLQLPFVYGKKIHRLRSSSLEAFTEDMDSLLGAYPNATLVYLPVSEKPTRQLYKYLDKKPASPLHFLLPSQDDFDMTSDKGRFQAFCEANGLPVPSSYKKEDIPRLEESFRPLILKPRSGQGSVGIRYFRKKEDLAELAHYNLDEYILQDLVQSSNQVAGAFFLCKDGVVQNAYTHQRLRTFPAEGGVTVYSQSTYSEDILKIGAALLEKLKWNGLAMIEFMYDEPSSSWKIIELNPRIWGSVLLSAFNNSGMLKDYVNLSLGNTTATVPALRPVYIRWLFPFEIMSFLKGKLPFGKFIRMNFKNTCYINFTYAGGYRSFSYLMYFALNFSSLKRFIKKIS